MPDQKPPAVGLSSPSLRPPLCAAPGAIWHVLLPTGERVWFRDGEFPKRYVNFKLLAVAWKVNK